MCCRAIGITEKIVSINAFGQIFLLNIRNVNIYIIMEAINLDKEITVYTSFLENKEKTPVKCLYGKKRNSPT